MKLERRESKIISITTGQEIRVCSKEVFDKKSIRVVAVDNIWHISGLPGNKDMITKNLTSWADWEGMCNYTGTIFYKTTFELDLKGIDNWSQGSSFSLSRYCHFSVFPNIHKNATSDFKNE